MKWIAPAAKDPGTATLEKRLWDAADELRANSGLKAGQYSSPVLGLIFLRFADARFAACRAKLEKAATGRRGSRVDDAGSYQAEGVLFLPAESRFSELLEFPEGGKDKKSLGEAVDDAMRGVERENPQLSGVLPKTYQRFQARTLKELVKTLSTIPVDLAGDLFGKIYEYFLGEFAMTEGQGGGEFYTPLSIVRLIVEVLEPFEGRVLDPACGSGGMFVQSARFVAEHNKNGRRGGISIHGIEKTDETGQLCRLNLAVHGLEGDIRHGGDINSYYEDPHNAVGRFDFVLANPPFNVDKVDKDRRARPTRGKLRLRDDAVRSWSRPFDSEVASAGVPREPVVSFSTEFGERACAGGSSSSAGRACHSGRRGMPPLQRRPPQLRPRLQDGGGRLGPLRQLGSGSRSARLGREPMNPKSIEQAKNPLLGRALPALLRARQRAEEVALATNTELVQVVDGKIVLVRPSRPAEQRNGR